MRTGALLALCLLLPGCPQRERGVVVEDDSPIVGARGQTTEALGIETVGGVLTPLIKAGTAVPCSTSEEFAPADGQTELTVTLLRGTGARASGAHALGRFRIVGIPDASGDTSLVRVTFSITERQISLSARALAHGNASQILRDGAAPAP